MYAYVCVCIFPLFYLYIFHCLRDMPPTGNDSCICPIHIHIHIWKAEVLRLNCIHHTTRTTSILLAYTCGTYMCGRGHLTHSRSIVVVAAGFHQNRYVIIDTQSAFIHISGITSLRDTPTTKHRPRLHMHMLKTSL